MKDFFESMLSKNGEVSSKRWWASIILSVICVCYLYCTYKQVQMLDVTYALISLAAILLGIETVFTKTNK